MQEHEFIVLTRLDKGAPIKGMYVIAKDRDGAMGRVPCEGKYSWQTCFKIGEAFAKIATDPNHEQSFVLRETLLLIGPLKRMRTSIPDMGKKHRYTRGEMIKIARRAEDLGLSVVPMTPYQYRITGENNVIDYYPISEKYCVVGTNEFKTDFFFKKNLKNIFSIENKPAAQ